MAKFHIGTPGGYDVEVTAESQDEALEVAKSEWQSLPRVIANTPGKGRVLEQDGDRFFVSPSFSTSDPDRIAQIMEGLDPGELSRTSFDEQAIAAAPVAARAIKFVEGVPGAGTFIDETMGSLLGQDATTAIRAQSAAMDRQRPGQSLALSLGGSAASIAPIAAALPEVATAKIASLLPSALTGMRTIPALVTGAGLGAGSGAIEGALSGFGRGTTPETRLEQSGEGAQFGATVGGVLGAAAPLATKAFENVAGLFRRTDVKSIAQDLGISTNAAKVIKNTFDQGGDLPLARANLAKAGQEGMLADAGEAAQALLDATAASGGPASQVARGAIDARATRTAASLDSTLDQILGTTPLGPQTALRDIAQRSAEPRAEAFGKAFDNIIDYTSEKGQRVNDVLSQIHPKVLNAAIEEANEELLEAGFKASSIRASINKAGEVVLSEPPSVRQLHEIKIALGSLSEGAKAEFGKATSKSRRFARLAGKLRSAIGEAAPDYNAAVRLGGDKIAEQNAFELGASLLKPGTEVEDVLLTLGKEPSVAQLEAARSGLRGAISKTLGDVRAIASDPSMEARQLRQAVSVLTSDNFKTKARQLLGSEADTLFAQIGEAEQSLLVRSAMARNSATAARQATQETIGDITAPGLVGEALAGEPINASKRLVQAVTGQTKEFTAIQRQQVFQDLSRALTEKQGPEASAALETLSRAMSGQAITEAETLAIARAAANVGFIGGTSAGTESLFGEQTRLGLAPAPQAAPTQLPGRVGGLVSGLLNNNGQQGGNTEGLLGFLLSQQGRR